MKVTVVIPTHNRAKLLPRAIGSVLAQTFQDFELVVVDDASTDDTLDVIRGYRDDRIRYIAHTHQSGVSHARNTGIKFAHGEYIALLDSDDEWLPHKLERQLCIFQCNRYPHLGIVGCRRMDVDASGKVLDVSMRSFRGELTETLLDGWMLHYSIMNSSIALIKKEVFDVVGLFDERLADNEDYDMWVRISLRYAFDAADEPLAKCYKWKSESRMSDVKYTANKCIFFQKHEAVFARFPVIYCRKARRLGTLLMLVGRVQLGRRYFMKAIRIDPISPTAIAALVHLLLSFCGERLYRFLRNTWSASGGGR